MHHVDRCIWICTVFLAAMMLEAAGEALCGEPAVRSIRTLVDHDQPAEDPIEKLDMRLMVYLDTTLGGEHIVTNILTQQKLILPAGDDSELVFSTDFTSFSVGGILEDDSDYNKHEVDM